MNEIIPKSWEEKKFGEIGKLQNGHAFKSSKFKKKGIPIIRISNINNGKVDLKNLVYSDHVDKLNKFLIKKNDILIAMSGATTGKVAVYQSNKKAYLNQRVGKFLIQKKELLHLEFLAKIVQQDFFLKKLLVDAIGAAQPNISSNQIENLSIKIPSLAEQKKITSILTSVDEVIEKIQAQIDKFQNLKKGMMNELFTKGIGHTEFKDSALGRIPKSWEVKKFNEISKSITCGVAATPKYVDSKDGIPFLSAQNIQNGKVVLKMYKHISPEFHQKLVKNTKPKLGDILYSRVGAGYGEAAAVEFDWEFSLYVSLTLIKLKEGNSTNFYKYFLNSALGKGQAKEGVFAGGGVPNLNVGVVKDFDVLVPNDKEQKEIASIFASMDKEIDVKKLIIQKTQSLKKSLMQDLLTGKVRVSVN